MIGTVGDISNENDWITQRYDVKKIEGEDERGGEEEAPHKISTPESSSSGIALLFSPFNQQGEAAEGKRSTGCNT